MTAAAYQVDGGRLLCADCLDEETELEREIDEEELVEIGWDQAADNRGRPRWPLCERCSAPLI